MADGKSKSDILSVVVVVVVVDCDCADAVVGDEAARL